MSTTGEVITINQETLEAANIILDAQWHDQYWNNYVVAGEGDILSLPEFRHAFCLPLLGYLDQFIAAADPSGTVNLAQWNEKLRKAQADQFNEADFNKTLTAIKHHKGDLLSLA